MVQIASPPDPARSGDGEGRPPTAFKAAFRIEGRVRDDASATDSATDMATDLAADLATDLATDLAADMAALLADHRRSLARGAFPAGGARPPPAPGLSEGRPARPRPRRVDKAADGGLSHDLHDCAGYHLALLQISLKLLEAFVPEGRGRAHLERTKLQLARFAADLGSLAAARAADARPDADCRDLDAFLAEILDAWSLATGLPVDFGCNRRPLRLPIALEQPLLRVLQESLTNVLKHARTASRVTVDLAVRRGVLTLTIGDDGCGFDPARLPRDTGAGRGDAGLGIGPASGMGLPGMAARMARIGGRLAVESTDGRGTRIRARLRLPASRERPVRSGGGRFGEARGAAPE